MCQAGENNKTRYEFLLSKNSYFEIIKEGGYYYLSPEVCKNIIISIGVMGIEIPTAVKIIRTEITKRETIIDLIPFLKLFDQEVLNLYSGDLAQSLLEAFVTDKGVEITVGYPKILVTNVS